MNKSIEKSYINILVIRICVILLSLQYIVSLPCYAQKHTIIGNFIIEPPTLISLGFEWYIEGDENHNAGAEVHYREKGKKEWNTFHPLLRIGNEKCGTPEWNFTTENMFAGSIFDLKPSTEYDCRIIITDPNIFV